MEWIHTTGKTLEEAIERALDELGIAENELEYEVVQEPKAGFLGRIGGQSAQIKARVRPISREKPDRRRRDSKRRGDRKSRGRGGRRPDGDRTSRGGDGGKGRGGHAGQDEGDEDRGTSGREGDSRRQRGGRGRTRESDRSERPDRKREESREARSEERTMSDVPIDEQAEAAAEFTRGLVERFGLDATVQSRGEDERVVVEVEGDDLGLLIGHQAVTMEAVRELVKTNLQRHTQGQNARVSIDIGGYGARRRAMLADFARDLAQTAKETGRAQSLEPMSPPDRKVVHDTVNEIDGVSTISEGEEPRRRVVIQPE